MRTRPGLVALATLAAFLAVAQGDDGQCGMPPETGGVETATNTRVPGRIIDITWRLAPDTVSFGSADGLGEFRKRVQRQEDGDLCNASQLDKLPAHSSTHVDAPGHFVLESYKSGRGVESLDLYKLNGPVLVVDVPHDTNITAEAMEDLHIPAGTERVIFKTVNTARRLLQDTPFHTEYTAFTKDGAEWLLANTDIRLVGVDYLSVAVYDDLRGAHITLLPNDVQVVEGLLLEEVAPGPYQLHCLPLKLAGSDGAPARCILIT